MSCILGKTTGFADLAIWPWLERFEVLGSRPDLGLGNLLDAEFKKLAAYVARMKQQPEVQAAIRPVEHHAAFFKSYLEGSPNYNVGIPAA